jgi:hypothetical protein
VKLSSQDIRNDFTPALPWNAFSARDLLTPLAGASKNFSEQLQIMGREAMRKQ